MKQVPEIRIAKLDSINETLSEDEYPALKLDAFTTECNQFIMEVEKHSWYENYLCYFLFTLLVNVTLLALYAVQVIVDHQPCLNSESHNITQDFKMAFGIGLFVLIADVINSNLLEIYLRFQVQLEEHKFGSPLASSVNSAIVTVTIGWFLRGGTLITSAF